MGNATTASQLSAAAAGVGGSPGTPVNTGGQAPVNGSIQGYQDPATVISQALQQGTGNLVSYPPNGLGVYYILFPFTAYSKNLYGGAINVNISETVALPVPKDIKFGHDQSYNTMNRSAVVGSLMSPGGNGSFGEKAASIAERAAGVGLNVVPGLGSALLNQAGLAPNPFMAVQYQSPEFRIHNFAWTFAPNSPNESRVLQQIIQIFQYHEAPDYAGSNLLYSYPDIVKPIYSNEGQLYPFKWCVIKSFGVDYAGGGAPSFKMGTQAPSIVQIAIQLEEIELFMRPDFTGTGSPADYSSYGGAAITGFAGRVAAGG